VQGSCRYCPGVIAPLTFGVYPLGIAGSPEGAASGFPDDYEAIGRAMAKLRGSGPPLLTRHYVNWYGARKTKSALRNVASFLARGGPLDLALCYRDRAGDVAAWGQFVERVVAEHGRELAAVQVTGEANLTGVPGAADGYFPRAREALATGLLRAAAVKRDVGATAAIGFAVAVNPEQSDFWSGLRNLAGSDFGAAADYAGIDLYPDVFGPPIGIDRMPGAVRWLLQNFRDQLLPLAGIGPATPIRICENGWPTGPRRSEDAQALVLESVVRTVSDLRAELNVTHWELFALRDADSSRDGLFYRVGVLHDDYTPKPAFWVLRDLIGELSAH
jgi:hypothetical protein